MILALVALAVVASVAGIGRDYLYAGVGARSGRPPREDVRVPPAPPGRLSRARPVG